MAPLELLERLQELGLSPEVIALARGMMFGDKSVIDPEMVQSFRTSAMSHLLAVSGLHVGVIMSLVWFILKPIETIVYLSFSAKPRPYYIFGTVKRLLVIIVTILYVWYIGAPASAVRAALMLCLCLIGWIMHRLPSIWNSLLMSALILLAIDPWNITQIGFQLSYLAVIGILLFQPWLEDRAFRWWERLILLSIAAQWFTVPLVAFYFHQVPFLSWLQGLLVVPLIPFFMGGLLMGVFFPSLHWLCNPIEALYGWITWISQQIGACERFLLGGHLFFYPSIFETIVAEFALFILLLCFHLLRYNAKRRSRSYNPSVLIKLLS